MTAPAHVKHFTFLSCGQGLQNAGSQVEIRGSNSGFFKEYSSYKSRNFSCEIMKSFVRKKQNLGQTFSNQLFCRCSRWFHLGLLHDLLLARKPRPRSSSARPTMPFVNQERLVLKFPNGCFEYHQPNDRRNYCAKSLYLWLRKTLGEEYGITHNERKSYGHQKRIHSI